MTTAFRASTCYTAGAAAEKAGSAVLWSILWLQALCQSAVGALNCGTPLQHSEFNVLKGRAEASRVAACTRHILERL